MKFCKKYSVKVLSEAISFKLTKAFSFVILLSCLNSSVSNRAFSKPAESINTYSAGLSSVIHGYFILIPSVLILVPSGNVSLDNLERTKDLPLFLFPTTPTINFSLSFMIS